MVNPPTAAQALYGHLRQGTREPVQQRRAPNSVADAMFPSLSKETKQREAQEAYWRAEQKARSARTAQRLGEIVDQLRAEKRER